MRTMRYTIFFGIVLLLGILMSACVDEFDRAERGGDGKSIRLTLSIPDNVVINPMTKATQAMSEEVKNITVLVYDNGYKLLASKYYSTGLTALSEGKAYTTDAIEVGNGATGYVFVVANAGDLRGATYETLKDKRFGLNGTLPQPIMCASEEPYSSEPTYSFKGISFDTKSNSSINAELVRIYSRVTVVVKRGDNLNSELTITPQTLKLFNVPQTGTLAGRNLINSAEESLRHGEELKSNHNGGKWFSDGSGEESTEVLYLYENMQPDGYCNGTGENKDQTSKTPKSFGEPITNTTQLLTDTKSSFIEVYAKYEKKQNPTTGWIKYRFFLGKDPFTNFSVQRNVNYKITLILNKNGGVDEATWRVETEKIPGKINVSDVYISYLGGSSVEMVVTGDVKGIASYSLGALTDPGNTGGKFENEEIVRNDSLLRIKFTSTTTNVHDYKEKVMPVTFTMTNGVKPYTVNVYQVPRLVDPIAIYKRANNDLATEIVVKAFNTKGILYGNQGRYDTLQSKGKWTAEIDEACKSWVRISTINQEGNYKTNSIEGDGAVHFWYKPKDRNVNSDGDELGIGNEGDIDKGRYGKITVRYHGTSCVHEIFLRQGYQPMTIPGDPEYAWSAYNCLGKTSNKGGEAGKTTTYPTQTGWLFNGGVNIAMHPFLPEYQVGIKENDRLIRYSDNKEHKYGYMDDKNNLLWNLSLNNSWQKNADVPSEQGPCPDGYIVADAWRYDALANKNKMLLYTGYVHDDDAKRGWKYENLAAGKDAEVDDNNHCNPAKGSLFVEKGGAKNLFFNYGKGVLKGVRNSNSDQYLLEEIGVGRRYTGIPDAPTTAMFEGFGYLSYNDGPGGGQSYGGWYWNATPFSTQRMGKVDFSYNVFSPVPTLIDVPYTGKDGIHIYANADFVRCVKGAPRTSFSVSAVFRFVFEVTGSNQTSNDLLIKIVPKGYYSKSWYFSHGQSRLVSNILDVPVYELIAVDKKTLKHVGQSYVSYSKDDLTSDRFITLTVDKLPQ